MSDFLPFALPDIGEEEINEVVDCLRSGWITTGPRAKKFEEEFATYIGAKHAIAVNSATAGLHLALDAIGLGPDDKVITTAYTFTATAEVIRYFYAQPIFCDIEEDSFNIDPVKLEQILESECTKPNHRIKAIIPVHIAGQACKMKKIMELAKKYNLKVIEDAAHALPCTSDGKMIGTIADITVFSFYATKTITTGEGGMITTNNPDYKTRMEIMRLHGFNRAAWDRYVSTKASWHYEIVAPGYKYNLTDIAASLGLHQLKKSDQFFAKRNAMAKKFDDAFKNHPQIKIPSIQNPNDKHSYHLYIIRVPEQKRDRFIDRMKELGVGCSVHFIPLHMQPYWRELCHLKEDDFPVATKVFKSVVSLPIYTKMTDQDQQKVISAALEAIK